MKIFSFPTLNAIETIKDLKQTKTFGDFPVFDFVFRVKLKNWKPLKFCFFIKLHLKVTFFLSEAILDFWFLDFEFLILSKIEVNENFPRFPSFRFQV